MWVRELFQGFTICSAKLQIEPRIVETFLLVAIGTSLHCRHIHIYIFFVGGGGGKEEADGLIRSKYGIYIVIYL